MTDLNECKRVVRESSDLSTKGEDGKALELLDHSIEDAVLKNDALRVRILSRHAAVISEHIGDLGSAARYLERSLPYSSEDPLTLYGLADVLSRQGKSDLAKQYAKQSYNFCVRRGSVEDQQLIDAIKRRWPDIAN
jgi:hypothetical protein